MSISIFGLAAIVLCTIFQSRAVPTPPKINIYEQTNNKFQGDIASVPKHPSKTRNGIKFAQEKWTSAIIPYQISSAITVAKQATIIKAMAAIQSRSCVRFVQRTTQRNYVNIIKTTNGCYSNVGMSGGPQDLSLQDDSTGTCMTYDIVIHELLHAVGLYHEQSRYDRDQYITVNYANIAAGSADQFDIVPLSDSDVYQTAYDYRSVMHYDKSSFARSKGLLTIVPKQPGFLDIIGNVQDASEIDMTKIRRIYNCDSTPTKTCADAASPSICVTYLRFCNDANVAKSCQKTCNKCS
jgi:astacin